MIFTLTTPDGYDDDSIKDELLVEDLDENQLLECWDDLDDFPFDPKDIPKDDDAKSKFILDLLQKLSKNPDLHFGANIPAC